MIGKLMLSKPMTTSFIASFVAILVIRDPAPAFVFDAGQYWAGAQAVAERQDEYTLGGLNIRGVFTAFVYFPAYLATVLAGATPTAAGWAVLVQNALFLSVLGAVVLPLLARRLVTIGPVHVALSAMLTAVLLSGFAPYPLMDLPAVLCAALAILLLSGGRWWSSLLGGAFLALAVNLRPAYALAAVLVIAVVTVTRWRGAPLAVLGGAAVIGAQAAYGWAQTGVVSIWPPASALVTAIQLNYAAYGVRYDTIPFTSQDPRLWHCSPSMATAVGDRLPGSTGELFGLLVSSLPDSALFATSKVTASLHWSAATPYADPGSQAVRPLGLLVIVLSCVGVVALAARLRRPATDRTVSLSLLALVAGVSITLVGSSPEARFALPLVVAGIIGTVVAEAAWHPGWQRTRAAGVAIGCVGVLTLLVIGLGWWALQLDVPPGDLTTEVCRTNAGSTPLS